MDWEAGKIPRFTDVSWRWIAYCASVIVVVGVVFAFLKEIELKRDVPCEIISPSDVRITGHDGLVTAVYVAPAATVRKGQPLFRLTRDLTLSTDGRPRPVFDEALRDRQTAATNAQFGDRVAALTARMHAVERTEAARMRELDALGDRQFRMRQMGDDARRRLARLEGAADYVIADRIEQARIEVRQNEAEIAQGDARHQALLADLETLRGGRRELDAQIRELRAQRDREVQDIDMRYEAARRDVTVSAPGDGVVTFSGLVPGNTLESDDVALVISTSPTPALSAALRIPSRQRGFVREGQTVRIKLDAFPYARFGSVAARIDSISDTTMTAATASSPASAPAGARPVDYMAWATLRGTTFGSSHPPLRILPGMRGTASVVVERRTIAEWVFEPLFQMIRS
ncbi:MULTISPECIES: HlyD family secretion protein [Burkholderia cepacia complex]|uniref:HlyD family secretion protein n=1 Tax=Burkholderia cepacia complex TaxID=87882 RepID=UPI0020118D7E|nr:MULTISPECIES: HlyD family efflux transporter periplasmic adaptor subunit [Burkholderia cepacia complex]MDN7585125.1 HlyD family efflux transporter periplasmic adaptor subunit [Burkholderia orbicola]